MPNPNWKPKYSEKTNAYRIPISIGDRIIKLLETETIDNINQLLDSTESITKKPDTLDELTAERELRKRLTKEITRLKDRIWYYKKTAKELERRLRKHEKTSDVFADEDRFR